VDGVLATNSTFNVSTTAGYIHVPSAATATSTAVNVFRAATSTAVIETLQAQS
jgi:hypothetical protein